ncbi:MAG: hypothetical protein ACK4QL_04610 [Pseudanabaenaceae cyanobacterium]
MQNEAEIVYAHVPVNPGALNNALVAQVCAGIERLAKPLLIHCSLHGDGDDLPRQKAGLDQGGVSGAGGENGVTQGVERFFLDYIERNCQPELNEEKT